MHVNKTIETAEGTVKFEGELSQNELDFVVKIGLNYLLARGALPNVSVVKDAGSVTGGEEPTTLQ